MTVEELRAELENIVPDITNLGFNNIDSGIVEKLNNCAVAAGELNMKEGKHLIENLLEAMNAIQEGKSKAESGSLRLTALDFYLKKHSDSGDVEDL
jgi:polyhydroxyalkanoate synthesis regulator phasin